MYSIQSTNFEDCEPEIGEQYVKMQKKVKKFKGTG